MAAFAARSDGGLTLRVRLTPKGGADRIDGIGEAGPAGGAALLVRVRAAPVDGAANAALVALLAKACGVPKSAVALVSGAQRRVKVLRIEAGAERLDAALARLEEAAAGAAAVR